ncbi:MAG: hypothetical protein M3O30_10920 [Planctomycetota bacterium]|nr:hypothetical protein [Planctomycetota bacterium]
MQCALGDNYVPSSIGDLKIEHVGGARGWYKIFDLETFSWGGLEVLDLYSIIKGLQGSLTFDNPAAPLCVGYCITRARIHEWTTLPETLIEWINYTGNISGTS